MPETRTLVIALTREQDDRAVFSAASEAGARVITVPLLRRIPRPPMAVAEALVAALPTGGWTDVVVSSAAAVEALSAGLRALGDGHRVVEALGGARAFAVGPGTASALAGLLTRPSDAVAAAPDAARLVEVMGRVGIAGRCVLFPAAEAALRTLPDGLRAHGAEVHEVACYATQVAPDAAGRISDALAHGVALWTVASPTAVRALADGLDAAGLPRGAVAVAAIGPTTAGAARDAGLTVVIEALVHTMPGLAAEVTTALRDGRIRPRT